ncbi:MAG TPA: SCO family protein [Polyangiaceae bacterium]|nr:SCO family protein [Polyangiaceae bacterium]
MPPVRFVWLVAAFWALTFSSCSLRERGGRDGAERAAPARADEGARAGGRDRAKGGGMWGANYFPDVPLVTHRGEKVRFFDLIKDKVVAVNFIYTKCSDSCPMETARMRDVARLLGDRLGRDVFFYSISIDPENDTPERLNEYAELWHTGPGWTFLTGSDEDVTLLRRKLGVYSADRKKKDHSLSMVIGNQATGRWMKRSPGENPYVLANELGQWLHNWKLPSTGERDYANAPEVRNISTGEELFRARCASCHTIGGGDTFAVDERRVGPDLFEVSKRRERAWLERWIMEPDRVLAEKDPTAMGLLETFKIVMPNMRLSHADARAVLKYLDEASAEAAKHSAYVRASTTVPAGGAAAPAAGGAAAPAGPLPERALAPARKALEAYEAMRARFAADDLAGARSHAAVLADEAMNAAADGGPARKALVALADAARAVGAAADIDAARLSFGGLSKSVITLLVADPKLREGRFLFVCPMAPGYQKWVQTAPALTNPYWGKRMLTCGNALNDWAI